MKNKQGLSTTATTTLVAVVVAAVAGGYFLVNSHSSPDQISGILSGNQTATSTCAIATSTAGTTGTSTATTTCFGILANSSSVNPSGNLSDMCDYLTADIVQSAFNVPVQYDQSASAMASTACPYQPSGNPEERGDVASLNIPQVAGLTPSLFNTLLNSYIRSGRGTAVNGIGDGLAVWIPEGNHNTGALWFQKSGQLFIINADPTAITGSTQSAEAAAEAMAQAVSSKLP